MHNIHAKEHMMTAYNCAAYQYQYVSMSEALEEIGLTA